MAGSYKGGWNCAETANVNNYDLEEVNSNNSRADENDGTLSSI